MEFVNNIQDDDFFAYYVTSINMEQNIKMYADRLLRLYNNATNNLAAVSNNDPIDSGHGIATEYGAVKLEDLRTAIKNMSNAVEVHYGSGQTKSVSVDDVISSIKKSRAEAAAACAGVLSLKDSISDDSKATASNVHAYYSELADQSSITANPTLAMVTDTITNTKVSIQERLSRLIHCFIPDTQPTDFNSIGKSGEYEIGTPWQAFTAALQNWDWDEPLLTAINFFHVQIYIGFRTSCLLITGIVNAFLGFGNWVSMKIAGKKFTRINDDNSLPDTGGFPFVLKGTTSDFGWMHEWEDDGFKEYIEDSFSGVATSIPVPGGLLLITNFSVNSDTQQVTVNCRFIPENQSNLVPAMDNRPESSTTPVCYMRYNQDWIDGEGSPGSTDRGFTRYMQHIVSNFPTNDPFAKGQCSYLDMENATDYTQWCSAYRPSFFFFAKAMNDMLDIDGENTSIFPYESHYDLVQFKKDITALGAPDVMNPFGLDGSLGDITYSSTPGLIESSSYNANSQVNGLALGLFKLVYGMCRFFRCKFLESRGDTGVLYAFPYMEQITSFPACGIHVSTSQEVQDQLRSYFTHVGAFIVITAAVVGTVVATLKLKKAATIASAQADLYYFSDEFKGTPDEWNTYVKMTKKADRLAALAGASVGAAGGSLSSPSSANDFSVITKLITG